MFLTSLNLNLILVFRFPPWKCRIGNVEGDIRSDNIIFEIFV